MPAAPNIPTLPLTADLLATLQPATYLHHTLTHSQRRPNTRTNSQSRPIICTTGSLTHCAGSSLIRIGDTAVVCGIQPEILLHNAVPDPPRERLVPPRTTTEAQVGEQEDIANLGLLVPNVELNTGCHPHFSPGEGKAPAQLQQSLSVRLLRLLLSTRLVPFEDLYIRRGRGPQSEAADEEKEQEVVGYWVLYITLLPLSLDGTTSLFDALWTALVAALKDVRLPKAWWDADWECIVCSDRLDETRSVRLRGQPTSLTFGVFEPGPHLWTAVADGEDIGEEMDTEEKEQKRWLLADPDGFEDGLCDETITVVLDRAKSGNATLLGLEQSGGCSIKIEELSSLTKIAEKRWKELNSVLPKG